MIASQHPRGRQYGHFKKLCNQLIATKSHDQITMRKLLTCIVALSLQLVVVLGSSPTQSFFSSNLRYKDNVSTRHSDSHLNTDWASSYDAGLFSPLEDFNSLSETKFSTFGHPAFPRHSVRIKKTPKDFCDSTVRYVNANRYVGCAWQVEHISHGAQF